MGARYSIDGRDTNTANTTILELRSTTAIRPRVAWVTIGSEATPAEMAANYEFNRTTTVGTSTGVTPQALDSAEPAAVATAGEAHSAEPTYTAGAVLLALSVNQRATTQWYANPGFELVLPAAANGLGLRAVTVNGSAVSVSSCWHYDE